MAILVPSWTGYKDDECVDALVTGSSEAFEQLRQDDIKRTRNTEQALVSTIRRLSEELRRTQERLASTRVTLKELEASTEGPAYGGVEATSDVAFIRRLPGVIGMRVDEYGRVVVHVRTGMLYRPGMLHRERWYDFGDYEIVLGVPRGQSTLDITCTRYGGILVKDEYYCNERGPCTLHDSARTLYWSGYERSGVGQGSFCFGSRTDQIRQMCNERRYAEMLHLVIATMCSVNSGDLRHLPATFHAYTLNRQQRDALRAEGYVLAADPAIEPTDD